MASEATNMAVRGNIHMNTKVQLKSLSSILRSDVTSEAVWRPPWPQAINMDTMVMKVVGFKSEVKLGF